MNFEPKIQLESWSCGRGGLKSDWLGRIALGENGVRGITKCCAHRGTSALRIRNLAVGEEIAP